MSTLDRMHYLSALELAELPYEERCAYLSALYAEMRAARP